MDVNDLAAKLGACASLDRVAAAQQLCQSAEDSRQAAVALVRATGDEDEQVQEWATAALEELETPEAADVPALIELVYDANSDVAYWAITLLGRLEAEAVTAVEALTSALSESRPLNVRQRAAWALGRIGPAAAASVDALKAAAGSDDPRLARLASAALESVAE